jgi:hypothetical protein
MPPSARKPAAKKPDDAEKDQICRRCWPQGWPAESGRSASCEHGQWSRDLPSEA